MSRLVFHPLTSEPILVSPERGDRPGAWGQQSGDRAPGTAMCPFCPGHEEETPPEIARAGGSDWSARVVPNKYPALAPIAGFASHEVLIDTAMHHSPIDTRAQRELELMVDQWRERFTSHAARPEIESVIIFRNEGRAAGQSIEHPHSQLVALPFIPPRLEAEMRCFTSSESCPLCAPRDAPDDDALVVARIDGMTIRVPSAPRMPYELWIVPELHQPDWRQCDSTSIASALGLSTRTLRARWPSAPFNVTLSTAPTQTTRSERFHWHVEILPRLTNIAGFELATDAWMNIVEPARAAAELRSARRF